MMLRTTSRWLTAALLVAAPVIAGCGGGASADGRPSVVATTTQAADMARAVAGPDARVSGLLPANADPHDFEVRPGDLEALAGATLVVRSGGEADDWLGEAIDASGAGAPVVTLSEHVELIGDDPHWWQDPRNGIRAVEAIRVALADADPANATAYARRAHRYTRRLRTLDAAIARCIDAVPRARRKLVTTHDSLAYYARRYGIEVVGAVIPSLSTQGQPSAGDVAALADTIRRERVRAVFAESSVSPKVERAIAREAGARLGPALYADTLGPEGSPGETYLGSLAANTRAIVSAGFGGRCDVEA